jgi:hypothetical protein
LFNINPHKASGPDNISGRILKINIIFQKSLQTGCIPSDWKHANVAPAYKKGEPLLGMLSIDSVVNTDLNCSFKMFAFCLVSATSCPSFFKGATPLLSVLRRVFLVSIDY